MKKPMLHSPRPAACLTPIVATSKRTPRTTRRGCVRPERSLTSATSSRTAFAANSGSWSMLGSSMSTTARDQLRGRESVVPQAPADPRRKAQGRSVPLARSIKRWKPRCSQSRSRASCRCRLASLTVSGPAISSKRSGRSSANARSLDHTHGGPRGDAWPSPFVHRLAMGSGKKRTALSAE
jgi:hypothetical protein